MTPGRGGVLLDPTAVVAGTAVVGAAPRALQEGEWEGAGAATIVGARVSIGHFCLIEEGVVIGSNTIVDAYARIEIGAWLGAGVLVTHNGFVGARAQIGDGAVVGGIVGERSVVGARARVFGTLVHSHLEPDRPWDAPGSAEPSAVIGEDAFVGAQAQVIGSVSIGERAFVCAGAIITRDVPPRHIARGTNEIVHYSKWPGGLADSSFFTAA
jgi:serine acetyltransferase